MNAPTVEVRELVAWDLDEDCYRERAIGHEKTRFENVIRCAREYVAQREPYVACSPLQEGETLQIQHLLEPIRQREDLREEYRGASWSFQVVDLRQLLAFQRRLVFAPAQKYLPIPEQHDWPGLIAYAFGPPRSTEYQVARNDSTPQGMTLHLSSGNPDLQLRVAREPSLDGSLPITFYGGCPFFEVAELNGRWFLRDGYHRAYRLLQAGVPLVPAIVLHFRTIEELGATEPWFFGQHQLFSDHPPRVTDFLEEDLVFHYQRTARHKIIRISIQESFEPFDEIQEKGEQR